jgi:hypothetical protein
MGKKLFTVEWAVILGHVSLERSRYVSLAHTSATNDDDLACSTSQ